MFRELVVYTCKNCGHAQFLSGDCRVCNGVMEIRYIGHNEMFRLPGQELSMTERVRHLYENEELWLK